MDSLFWRDSLVEEDVQEIGLLPTGALAPCLDSSLKKLQHAARYRPRVMPAKLVPYLIRERASKGQASRGLEARLRGHDV
jgi:hypothetical protein